MFSALMVDFRSWEVLFHESCAQRLVGESQFPRQGRSSSMRGGHDVLRCPAIIRGVDVTSPDGMAVLARLCSARFGLVAGASETLASSDCRSVCRFCCL